MGLFTKVTVSITLAFGLSACGTHVLLEAQQNGGEMAGMFDIAFPAVMLVQTADGTDELLEGTLIGNISGSSTYNFVGPTSGNCSGSASAEGIASMSCDNGFEMTVNNGRQRPKMSGTFVQTGEWNGGPFVAVMGWGNEANEAAVRAALPAAQAG